MARPDRAPAGKLAPLLRDLTQGDLLTLGAVSIVGRGPTEVVSAAGGSPRTQEIWSVTVESDLGWYVIISGPCDIVRDPAVEPCLVVAPLATVSHDRYQQLRSGEYSPREFPLPVSQVARVVRPSDPADFWPVADLRYVTSVDKAALLHADVESRRPLTGPQQQRFSTWVGRRYNRPAHADQLETHVLAKAGTKISRLAAQFAVAAKPGALDAEVRLIGAAREWLIGGTERDIEINLVLDDRSAEAAGFHDRSAHQIDVKQVEGAARKLQTVLAATLPPDSGYALAVKPITLDGIHAATYLSLEPWLWADHIDPLAED